MANYDKNSPDSTVLNNLAPEDTILSDMNTELCLNEDDSSSGIVRIPFEFDCCSNVPTKKVQTQSDDDNDTDAYVPFKRPKSTRSYCRKKLTIAHEGDTPLELVGRQIWRGSLLMSDYILWKQQNFMNSTVIELGGGVGVVGVALNIILNHHLGKVFITDYDIGALALAERNILANSHLNLHSKIDEDNEISNLLPNVMVRHVDWYSSNLFNWRPLPPNQHESSSLKIENKFNWTNNDINSLEKLDYILCADCIYDENLTNALFRTIRCLLSQYNRKAICYLAMEKRFNFELATLSVQAHGFRCFQKHISENQDPRVFEVVQKKISESEPDYVLRPTGDTVWLVGSAIPCEFPQYFSYHRASQLEFWRICCGDTKTE